MRNIVVEKSAKKETRNKYLEEPPVATTPDTPKCNVFCLRIGTVIPIYVCNDDITNCKRCGVDGFYILAGYGCFAVCVIPCKEFSGDIA